MDNLPIRKRLRVKWHDYNGGAYFVTSCTKDRHHYFGEIVGDQIYYTTIGKYLYDTLVNYNRHNPNVYITLFSVMPNHFHAILIINPDIDPYSTEYQNIRQKKLLSINVGKIKAIVSRFANENQIPFNWQRGFHEHIIRDTSKANKIFEYIENNVLQWAADKYNS